MAEKHTQPLHITNLPPPAFIDGKLDAEEMAERITTNILPSTSAFEGCGDPGIQTLNPLYAGVSNTFLFWAVSKI